jgi:hypothetical protein
MARISRAGLTHFHPIRPDGGVLLRTALVSAVLALGVPASVHAGAPATTTIQFGSPAITGTSTIAPLPAAQYLEQGIEFVDAAVQPISQPIVINDGSAYLFLDPAHARSGKQVLASYTVTDENLQSLAGFLVHLTRFSSSVSLYAGASSPQNPSSNAGATVQMTGYDADGKVVAAKSASVGAKVATLISIDAANANIAYVSVQIPGFAAPRLEVDQLSFVTPDGAALTNTPCIGCNLHESPFVLNSDGKLTGKPPPSLIIPKILSVSQGVGNPVKIVGSKPFTDAAAVFFGKVAQPSFLMTGNTISAYPPKGLPPGANLRIAVLLKNASGQAMAYSHQTSETTIGEVDATGPIPDDPLQIEDDAWVQGQGRSFHLESPKNLMVDTPYPVFYVQTQFSYAPALESKFPLKINGYAGNKARFAAMLQMCVIDPKINIPIWPIPFGLEQASADFANENEPCKNWDGTSGRWAAVGPLVTKTLLETGSAYLGVPTGAKVFDDQNYLRTLRIGVWVWLTDTQCCDGNTRLDHRYTDAFNVAVIPNAFFQIKMQPQTIVFAPPGDQSIASFTTASTFNTNYTVGNSDTQSNKITSDDNSSWAASFKMSAQVSSSSPSASASGDVTSGMGGGFDNTTTTGSGVQNGALLGGSSALSVSSTLGVGANPLTTPGNGMVCASATNCATQTKSANWWAGQPFWNDTFVLRVHPQYAFYVLGNKTDRAIMYASIKGQTEEQVLQLWACANARKLYGQNQCVIPYTTTSPESVNGGDPVYVGISKTEVLTATEAKHMLALDPFYLDGQGAAVAADRASLVGTYRYGTSIAVTRANPATVIVNNTQAQQQQNSSQTTYTSSIINTTSDTETTGFDFAAALILGFGFGESTTQTDKTSIEADTQSVYQSSTATSKQVVTSMTATLNDLDNTSPTCKTCHNPLDSAPTVTVWLDNTFGGFMFQDPTAGPPPSAAQRAAWEAQFDLPSMVMAQEQARHRFDDVADDSPQKVAIGMLTRLAVMSGYADGKFHPDEPMSRMQLADGLNQALSLATPKSSISFDDLSAKSPLHAAAQAVVSAGLLTSSAGKFRPTDTISHDDLRTTLGLAFKAAAPQVASGGAPVTRGEAAQLLFAAIAART